MKRFALVFFLLVLMVSFTGNVLAADSTKIKLSYNGPPDIFKSPNHAYAAIFKRIVELESGGKFEVVLYHSSQLGKERDRLDQLKTGVCQMNIASLGGLSQIYPQAYLFFIPFLFSSYEVAHEVLDNSQFIKDFRSDCSEKTGLLLLDPVEVGQFLVLTNNKRPINKLSDMKGIKFRGMDPGQVAFYKALGASGIPIAWTEVYTSLQTGVVDGQMNPPAIIVWGKLFEVQKYLTMTRHMYGVQYSMVNPKWFKSLSREDQALIMKAHRMAVKSVRGLDQILETSDLTFLAKEGMKINQPSPAEIKKMRDVGQPAYTKWLSEKVDKSWIDKIIKAAAEAEVVVKERQSTF